MDVKVVNRADINTQLWLDLYDGTKYLTNLWWYDRLPLTARPGWRTGFGAEFPDTTQEEALQAALVAHRLRLTHMKE